MFDLKRFFFIVFFYISFFFSISYAEEVKQIEVIGNERISTETIAIFGDLALGKNYEAPDISDLIKKLYETQFFSEISVNINNNKLTITVKENSIVNEIVFNGEKAKKYTEKIRELLTLKEKTPFLDFCPIRLF